MFSSELDRDRELMRGEVEGWDSAGPSEGAQSRESAKPSDPRCCFDTHHTHRKVGKSSYLKIKPHIFFSCLEKSAPA